MADTSILLDAVGEYLARMDADEFRSFVASVRQPDETKELLRQGPRR